MIYVVLGFMLAMFPFYCAWRRYGAPLEDAMERWLFGSTLRQIYTAQIAVNLGLLVWLYGWFSVVAVWRVR